MERNDSDFGIDDEAENGDVEKVQMPDILVMESQKTTAERVFLVQGFYLIEVHYFI